MSGVPSQNSEKSKMTKKVLDVKTFYSNHFPTDKKTFKWRSSLLGLILSIISVLFAKYYVLPSNIQNDNQIAIIIVYTIIALAVAYELYYGLEIGDRKQLTPWILFKIQEIIWNIVSIAFCVVRFVEQDEENNADHTYSLPLLLLSLTFVTNFLLTYIIASKSIRHFCGTKPKIYVEDEDIYDNYNNV